MTLKDGLLVKVTALLPIMEKTKLIYKLLPRLTQRIKLKLRKPKSMRELLLQHIKKF